MMDRIGGYGRGIGGGRHGQRNHGHAGRPMHGARGRGDRNQVRESAVDIYEQICEQRRKRGYVGYSELRF